MKVWKVSEFFLIEYATVHFEKSYKKVMKYLKPPRELTSMGPFKSEWMTPRSSEDKDELFLDIAVW